MSLFQALRPQFFLESSQTLHPSFPWIWDPQAGSNPCDLTPFQVLHPQFFPGFNPYRVTPSRAEHSQFFLDPPQALHPKFSLYPGSTGGIQSCVLTPSQALHSPFFQADPIHLAELFWNFFPSWEPSTPCDPRDPPGNPLEKPLPGDYLGSFPGSAPGGIPHPEIQTLKSGHPSLDRFPVDPWITERSTESLE